MRTEQLRHGPSPLISKCSGWLAITLAISFACVDAQDHSGHTPSDGRGLRAANTICQPDFITYLAPFVDPLPFPQVAKPARTNFNYCLTVATSICYTNGLPEYDMPMTVLTQQFHRDLPPMEVWGYAGSYPGPTIETVTNAPILVNWINRLPTNYPAWLPPNLNNHGASTQVHTVVHLHGGATLPRYDGYPTNTFTTGFSDQYFYGNIDFNNDGELLWYHDHAVGLTANNVYAGLAGFYFVRNPAFEASLNIPTNAPYEVPLVIQDRDFQTNCPPATLLFGGVFPWHYFATVNGKVMPYLDVEPRRYRFRILNGANFRSFALNLAVADAAGNLQSNTPPAFYVIGNEDGFLQQAVSISPTNASAFAVTSLNIMSGERYDVMIDFTQFTNKIIIMTNTPPGTGNLNPPQIPEVPFNVNLTNIMQFRVGSNVTSLANNNLPTGIIVTNWVATSHMVAQAITNRHVTLDLNSTYNEVPFPGPPFNPTNGTPFALLNMKLFEDPITDFPRAGTTEIWSIINLSNESHPIHIHLLDFRVVDRARFNGFTVLTNVPVTMPTGASNYINDRLKGTLRPLTNYVGTPRTAQPFESGPKDVVHAAPFSVTRIVMFWPTNALFYLTPSAKSLDPSTSGRYVYHCHILDHEDDDMMRPLQLLPVALQMVQMPDPGVNVAGNNHFRLGISGRFGETYRIESSTSLPGIWVPLPLPDLAGSEDLIRIVPPSTLDPLTFYRVRRVSP